MGIYTSLMFAVIFMALYVVCAKSGSHVATLLCALFSGFFVGRVLAVLMGLSS